MCKMDLARCPTRPRCDRDDGRRDLFFFLDQAGQAPVAMFPAADGPIIAAFEEHCP
jgi:hypothetical protein